ncbi:hypothetical protein GMAR_ORF111 [Golden Marseillevirus]|uniref:hypothetical protein n=1 Tax=Golden Marseillevirus TaxID=1720526 RepID=UPI000877AF36|nr:hypothetical protein GMAR_ORF111 [Golden Marseillevirus]ALX27485.1 hypothetical protein GMAR_ORF111 [Golden Marseillevirus]
MPHMRLMKNFAPLYFAGTFAEKFSRQGKRGRVFTFQKSVVRNKKFLFLMHKFLPKRERIALGLCLPQLIPKEEEFLEYFGVTSLVNGCIGYSFTTLPNEKLHGTLEITFIQPGEKRPRIICSAEFHRGLPVSTIVVESIYGENRIAELFFSEGRPFKILEKKDGEMVHEENIEWGTDSFKIGQKEYLDFKITENVGGSSDLAYGSFFLDTVCGLLLNFSDELYARRKDSDESRMICLPVFAK